MPPMSPLRLWNTSHTFNSWQVDAGVLVDPDAVADDPQRSLFEGPGASDQLGEKQMDFTSCGWEALPLLSGIVKMGNPF